MKPMYTEDATKKLREIIEQTEASFLHSDISALEQKKIDLVKKMKEDTENKEYPIMFKVLIGTLIILGLILVIAQQVYWMLIPMLIGLGYYFFVKIRLKREIEKLPIYQNNINQYIYEGYLIKDMRFTAVKFGFMLFFPFICFVLGMMLENKENTLPIWQALIVAYVLSTIAWFIFFKDDEAQLTSLDQEIKSLIPSEDSV